MFAQSVFLLPLLFGPCVTEVLYTRSGESLTSVPGVFIPADTTTLDLGDNSLDSAAIEPLPCLSALRKLLIPTNLLTEFPDLSCMAATLWEVNFDNNFLTTVDAGRLNALPELKYIFLNNNQLTTFPDAPAVQFLYRLDLRQNLLTSVPVLTHAGSGPMDRLDLKNNHITSMSQEASRAFPNLRTLFLSFNRLTEFPPIAGNMPKLAYLELASNSIQSIPRDFLMNQRKIITFRVQDNVLTDLPNPCFVESGTFHLKASSNPIHCGCDLKPTLEAIKSGFLTLELPITCASPAPLVGRSLASLTVQELHDDCTDGHATHFASTDGYRCDLPDITAVYPVSSVVECGGLCLQSPGCTTFGFEPSGPLNGTCGVSGAGGSAAPWGYFSSHYTAF